MGFTFKPNGFHLQTQWVSFSNPMDLIFKSNGFGLGLRAYGAGVGVGLVGN
jgi:hypothetical protein